MQNYTNEQRSRKCTTIINILISAIFCICSGCSLIGEKYGSNSNINLCNLKHALSDIGDIVPCPLSGEYVPGYLYRITNNGNVAVYVPDKSNQIFNTNSTDVNFETSKRINFSRSEFEAFINNKKIKDYTNVNSRFDEPSSPSFVQLTIKDGIKKYISDEDIKDIDYRIIAEKEDGQHYLVRSSTYANKLSFKYLNRESFSIDLSMVSTLIADSFLGLEARHTKVEKGGLELDFDKPTLIYYQAELIKKKRKWGRTSMSSIFLGNRDNGFQALPFFGVLIGGIISYKYNEKYKISNSRYLEEKELNNSKKYFEESKDNRNISNIALLASVIIWTTNIVRTYVDDNYRHNLQKKTPLSLLFKNNSVELNFENKY